MPEPIEMSRTEAERLLRTGVVGRVAFSGPDGPMIVPVNYAVVDDAIVLRTSAYSLLGTHGREAVVAVEVDELDPDDQRAWSVVARGRLEVVTDVGALAHIRATWEPRPWASGHRTLFLRLPWVELTGRELGRGWSPEVDLPCGQQVAT